MATTGSLNPRLKAQLERTPKIAVEAAARAMEEGADEIVAFMKAAAPVDTGRLRNSIAWTWGDAPEGSVVIDEIRSGQNKGRQYAKLRITFYVGLRGAGEYDKGYYAHMVEFGTKKMAAQPFFIPGWKANKAKYNRKIRAAVRRAIKEALNG